MDASAHYHVCHVRIHHMILEWEVSSVPNIYVS
jgi:hypothetical protein